jgi:iron complex outermembrane receptor protein
MLRDYIILGAAGSALLMATPAAGQATANAVTGAGDAFGFRNGDEAVGIYDETSVRGFNLEAAGNYRIEGSYFVRNSGVSHFFLENTTVRIGYNTLGAILPGPSGVVDYRLRDPARGERDSLTVGLDQYAQPYTELHLKHRSRDDRASYSIGVGRVFNVRDAQGGRGGESLLVAGTARLSAGPVTGRVFFGEYQYERAGGFRIAADGDALPPRIERGRYLGQPWARESGQRRIAGVLADVSTSASSGIGATAVVSQEDPTRGYTQIFAAMRPDRTIAARVVAVPQQRSTAWSGELRAHVARTTGRLAQRVDVTFRGRVQRARIGGAQVVDLGRAAFGEAPAETARPVLDPDAANLRDRVEQFGVGLTYRAAFDGRVRVNVGALQTDYRKSFTAADGRVETGRSAPLLYNAGLAWRVGRDVEIYGSYSRGLEEAGVAPAVATNRNEVLSAIAVTQREIGLRIAPAKGLGFVIAGFDTRKPYAGIDAAGAYRFLGRVRHRGIEASLSGALSRDMSLVLGGVLIDPALTGDEIASGRVGGTPVGVPRLRAIANLDYRIAHIPGLSVDGGVSYIGGRAARSRIAAPGASQPRVEAIATVNLGVRYGFRIGGRDLVARAQLLNLFDQWSWDVNGSETLSYTAPRRARLVLTTLF